MASAGGHWLKLAQGDIGKLVFVPRGQTASQAIAGRKADGGGFPGSLSETQSIKGLGGSTGAMLVQDNSGNLYVQKKGAGTGHLLEESYADNAYKALGVDVADHRIYPTAGGPVKLAKFVDGQTLAQAQSNNPAQADKAIVAIKKGFAADAVLGNWDVIGLGRDNIMIGKNGKVYRIDNGGALRYRAQGALKKGWGEFPDELFTMRSQGQSGSIFGSLGAKDVAAQSRALLTRRGALLKSLPKDLQGVMSARLGRLSQYASIHKTLSAKGFSDKAIDGFTQKLWAGLKSGSIKFDPKKPADIIKSFELIGG